MLNRIIHFSLHNRLTIIALAIVLLTAGMIALTRTEVDIFPDLNAPTVVVMTEGAGLAPEEVEKLVTFPVETAVNGAAGVRRVRSSSSTGFSVVWVEFDWGTDPYRARQIVTEKLAEVSGKLPPGVGAPTLGPQSSILGEIMIIGLTAPEGKTSLRELRTIADRLIRPRLLALGGVSQVAVLGGDVKEYQIRLSPERMRQYGVTFDEVMNAVNGLNDNASGGVFYEYGNEYVVKGDVNITDAEQLSRSVIRGSTSSNSAPVTVGDIAEVTIGSKMPQIGVASVATQPAVLLTVTKQPAAGTIGLTKKIDEALKELEPSLPKDVKVASDIFRQSDFIDNSISNLQESLLEGAVFVIVVLFFFLMNLRTTLISLVAMPMSIIIAVLVLHFMGFTINTMSLGGIAIAIGSLVDDAIVDVENVYKRLKANRALSLSEQRPILTVVYEASAEVRMPIFNSSLIIIAAFMPLFFLSGIEGRLLIPLGVAFIVALLASTLVALTVTPVLCVYLLGSSKAVKVMDRQPKTAASLRRWYSIGLRWVLAHGRMMLIMTGVMFAVACGLYFTLGRGFLPGFNEGSFTVNVAALPGLSLQESDNVGRVAEQLLLSVPEIRTVARKTGRAELDEHSQGVNSSEIEAPYILDKGRSRTEVLADIRHKLSEIPGAAIEVGQPISHRMDAMLSGTEAQIAIKLFGDDLTKLHSYGTAIKKVITEVPGVVDVNIEQQVERPQVDIRPRREAMAAYGVTMPQFARFVRTALGGEVVSQVYEDGLPYDLTVILPQELRGSFESIQDLPIDTDMGPVPFSQVAEMVSTTGPNSVSREDVRRRIVISANVEGRDLRGAVNEINQRVAEKVTLPQGYYVNYGGQFESEARASRTLGWATLGALVVILMLLYQEFKNFGESLIILVNMPLAMIGGILILVITGGEINIPAIIGFIALLGIATRNGMLLISRYNHLAEEGVGLAERIQIGSSDRLLPIVMTALTSALALVPLALRGHDPGNEIQSPLAVVILGGLVSSTALNIFVIPILYRLLEERKAKRLQQANPYK